MRALVRIALAALLAWPAAGAESRRGPIVLAVEKVSPAVVNIATEQLVTRREDPRGATDPYFEEFFRDFGEPRVAERYELASLGSGTLIDPRGYVLTNEHVVARASRIKVLLADEREFEATVVGTDPVSDLAVLKIRAPDRLPAVPLGSSAELVIGETLIVIGNPFGLSHSVTTGVLSSRSRTVRVGERRFGDFLQTDAAINPGNSGGPILDIDGNVVGIATAIYSGGHGIGFAIPVDRARRIVESILSHGTPSPFWIGVGAKPAAAELRATLGLAPGQGLLITHVVEGSPAANAGLAPGDLMVSAGGRPIGSPAELDAALASRSGNGGTRIELVRDRRRSTVTVKPLEAGSPQLAAIAESVLGLVVGRREGGEPGLVVRAVRSGGRAELRGFRAGDLLFEVDGVRLEGLDSYRSAFYRALLKGSALFLVQHEDSVFYVPLTLE